MAEAARREDWPRTVAEREAKPANPFRAGAGADSYGPIDVSPRDQLLGESWLVAAKRGD